LKGDIDFIIIIFWKKGSFGNTKENFYELSGFIKLRSVLIHLYK